MRTAHLKYSCAIAVMAFSLSAAAPVWAQETTAAAPAADSAVGDAIPEIIVTAQKRSQSLRDVPISIQVVTGETLRDNDLNDLHNIAATLPAVTITDNGVAQYLFIRGIGSGENSGFEQSVGTFIDGIYVGRGRTSRQQQLDLERIELLRGPQSIFFGNSAIAGAFNIATANPGKKWEGYVNAQYEFQQNGKEIEAAVGGPITDTLGIRLAGRYAKTRGWVTNIIDDTTAPASESYSFRATIAWEPTDSLKLVYKGSYGRNHSFGTPYEALKCPPTSGAPGLPCVLNSIDPAGNTIPLDYRKVSGNQSTAALFPLNAPTPDFPDENFKQTSTIQSLNMDLDLGVGTLSSTTGYLHSKEPNIYDPDQTRYFLIHVDSRERFSQFSQELRFASKEGGPFEYIFGGYFHHTKLNLYGHGRFNLVSPAAVGPFPAGTPIQADSLTITEQKEDLYSVFGQLKYKFTDALALSVGGRYANVKKDVSLEVRYDNLTNTGPADVFSAAALASLQKAVPGIYTGNLKNDKFTPEVVLDYDFNRELHLYAKYSKGFKAGGFDGGFNGAPGPLNNPPGFQFSPEKVNAFELGAKASLLGNRLQVNLAAFRSEYSDLQVAIFDSVSTETVVKNVGKSISQGIEFEATYRPTSALRFHTAFTILDAHYKDFKIAPCTSEEKVVAGSGCFLTGQKDLSGEDLQFSPGFSGTFDVNYEIPIMDNYLVSANVQANYSDAYNTTLDNDPDFRVPHNIHMTARLAFGGLEKNWSVAMLVKNLTNQKNFTAGINWPFATGSKLITREQPRTIAIVANYNF